MLLKYAFKDFLDVRKFKNTAQKNIRNYLTLLGKFVNYCTDHEVVMLRALYKVMGEIIGCITERTVTKQVQLILSCGE